MCGIAGIVYADARRAQDGRALVSRMSQTLAHRGPDSSGVWNDGVAFLGHRRLSIIDLSSAGCQPMVDASGRYALAYNGEVYNYVEIRHELESKGHRFRSTTDSEVLLAAYAEWGAAALDRCNGMWAFAIWDRRERTLFCARDRAGKKPLYYVVDDDGSFFFASEIKALRAAGFRFGLNPQAAFDFLTQGTYGHLEGESFFAGVSQLPPGHSLTLRPGSAPVVRRYWDVPVVAPRDRVPYDDAFRARFRELLTDAVRLRLRSDVPVGATLSGGLDSSTLALIIDDVTGGAPLHLFSSLYPGMRHDETPYFEAVVARLRQPIVHRVVPETEGWRERLLTVLDHQEEPFGDTSIFAHFHLMAAARREGVPVIISGQGGDELLLGYPSMVQAYIGHLLGTGHLIRGAAEVRAWAHSMGWSVPQTLKNVALHALPLKLRDQVRQRALGPMIAHVTPALRRRVTLRRFADEPGRTSFDSYIVQVFKRFAIPHLTHYDDRNAMAFAVEGRMPFLDYRLVELMFGVRYEAHYRGGFTKRVLRDAFADRLPPIVRERRDKIGFYTPLAHWMRAQAAWVRETMSEEYVRELGVIDAPRYLRRLADLERGDDTAELEVWRGFIFHLWARRFGVAALDGRPAPRSTAWAAADDASRVETPVSGVESVA